MKSALKTVFILAVFVVIFTISGCASYDKNPYFVDRAAFTPEDQRLWTRPTEFGFEVMGDIEGYASVSRVFGIVVNGEAPSRASILGFIPGNDPFARSAALDAITQSGADGIYVTSYTKKVSGFFPFFLKTEAYVKGKALKLVDLGQVPKDRSDKERYLKVAPPGITPSMILE